MPVGEHLEETDFKLILMNVTWTCFSQELSPPFSSGWIIANLSIRVELSLALFDPENQTIVVKVCLLMKIGFDRNCKYLEFQTNL